MRFRTNLLLSVVGVVLAAAPGTAQVEPSTLSPGSVAPDFLLTGATRFGVLRDPVRLSDYRGDAVVIGFFFKVRTRG
jgi:hypothetical protein